MPALHLSEPRSVLHPLRAAVARFALSSTPALAIDAYRVLVGATAACWFAEQLARLRPSFADALWLGPPAAACLALGVRPRICAALLFALASATTGLMPRALLGDYCVTVALFWLVLLPVGHTLTLGGLRAHGPAAVARWREQRVEGFTTRLCLLHVAFVYLNVGAWRATMPDWPASRALEACLCLIPSLYMLPRSHPLRWLASLLQLGVHGYLAWMLRDAYVNVVLAASAVLHWRERFGRADAEPAPFAAQAAPVPLGAACAVSAAYTLVAGLLVIGQRLGDAPLVERSGALLELAGLLPGFLIARVAGTAPLP